MVPAEAAQPLDKEMVSNTSAAATDIYGTQTIFVIKDVKTCILMYAGAKSV